MVIKLNCKKSDVIVSGITRVNSRTSGITIYHSPEERQVLFFNKLLQKLHEVTLSK